MSSEEKILFLEACENGDLELLQTLYNEYANQDELLTFVDSTGHNAFLSVCKYGHVECAVWLLEQRVNKFSVNKLGQNALDLANKNNHTQMIEWLQAVDFDIEVFN